MTQNMINSNEEKTNPNYNNNMTPGNNMKSNTHLTRLNSTSTNKGFIL